MKKYALVMLLLTGCASTAPVQTYRSADNPEPLQISGTYDNLSTVTILVNGNEAATGKMGFFGHPFDFSGTYDGRTIDSHCSESTAGLSCLVFVDNERAATLTF